MSLALVAVFCQASPSGDRIVDCGTAAVYCLCRFQQADADFAAVRNALAPFGSAPYSMADLKAALTTLGVSTQSVRAGERELPDRTPFVAYMQNGVIGHFSTCRIDRGENFAEAIDAAGTWRGTPAEMVKQRGWTGIVLMPTPPRWPHWGLAFAGLVLGAAIAWQAGVGNRRSSSSNQPTAPECR